MSKIEYKHNETEILQQIKEYIDSTYDQHYSNGKTQAIDFIIDAGHGEGFAIGNIMKYCSRYGKKKGKNRADLLKIAHYALLAIHSHDRGERK